MEIENTKTILLCIDVIEKSREVLADVLEKVEKFHIDEMTEYGRNDIYGLDVFCKRIKSDLDCADNNTENMKEQISVADEKEITEAVLRVEDILIDDLSLPKSQPIPNQPALDELANELFKPKLVEADLVVNPTMTKFSKALGL